MIQKLLQFNLVQCHCGYLQLFLQLRSAWAGWCIYSLVRSRGRPERGLDGSLFTAPHRAGLP